MCKWSYYIGNPRVHTGAWFDRFEIDLKLIVFQGPYAGYDIDPTWMDLRLIQVRFEKVFRLV